MNERIICSSVAERSVGGRAVEPCFRLGHGIAYTVAVWYTANVASCTPDNGAQAKRPLFPLAPHLVCPSQEGATTCPLGRATSTSFRPSAEELNLAVHAERRSCPRQHASPFSVTGIWLEGLFRSALPVARPTMTDMKTQKHLHRIADSQEELDLQCPFISLSASTCRRAPDGNNGLDDNA
eukprot:scaffold2377_cov376-Prasinococcus_capsulatus_cf.AAC.4